MQALASGISLVQPQKKAVFPYSNSLYVEGDCRVLIDAGSGYDAYREPIAKGVDLVLLSHYHFDHTNGLEYFPGSQIMASYEELWAYTDEDAYTASTGYHIWDDLMDVPRKNVFASTFVQPDDIPTMPGFRRIELNGCFRDNDRFDLGGTSVQAIHTPGHTPGHYSFYFPDEGILFAGDYDLSPWGPWYGALVSDFDLLADSVERLIALQPRMIVSSHRQHIYTENLAEQMRAFLEAPLQKEARIMEYLAVPRRLKDVLGQDFIAVYPPRSSYQVFWNRMMAKKHLDRLLKRGYIIKVNGDFYVQKGGA